MSCLNSAKSLQKFLRLLRRNVISKRIFHENCIEEVPEVKNKCAPISFVRQPCAIVSANTKVNPNPPSVYIFKSMWEKPKCCVVCDPTFAPVRHDIKYLKSNPDWGKRVYKRTWCKCPDRCLIKKKYCASEKIKIPLPELRPRGVGNPDAKWCVKIVGCGNVDGEKVRPRVVCKPIKKSCPCQKRCTLYPSFSECIQKCPKLKHKRTECMCLSQSGLCFINEHMGDDMRAKMKRK